MTLILSCCTDYHHSTFSIEMLMKYSIDPVLQKQRSNYLYELLTLTHLIVNRGQLFLFGQLSRYSVPVNHPYFFTVVNNAGISEIRKSNCILIHPVKVSINNGLTRLFLKWSSLPIHCRLISNVTLHKCKLLHFRLKCDLGLNCFKMI